MLVSHKQLDTYPIPKIVNVLTEGFSDYFVPIAFTQELLFQMMSLYAVDLSKSYMLSADGVAAGVALVGRRGAQSRLATMAIMPEYRAKGLGSYCMEQLIADAKQRGETSISLEVIEQNEAGIKLYEKYGFEKVRRLLGYSFDTTGLVPKEIEQGVLKEISLATLASYVLQDGLADLPWQISGETLGNMALPSRAFELDGAAIAVSDLEQDTVVIRSLFVKPEVRGQGKAKQLLEVMMTQYPKKVWKVPILCPEKVGRFFEGVGFEKETLSQLQMNYEILV